MQKTEDPCSNKIPRAIDDEFLQDKLLELTQCGESGRLARNEGLPFDKADVIHLEYCSKKNCFKNLHLQSFFYWFCIHAEREHKFACIAFKSCCTFTSAFNEIIFWYTGSPQKYTTMSDVPNV